MIIEYKKNGKEVDMYATVFMNYDVVLTIVLEDSSKWLALAFECTRHCLADKPSFFLKNNQHSTFMESVLMHSDIKISGNLYSDSNLLFTDIFNLFPDSFQHVVAHFEKDYRILSYADSGFTGKNEKRKLRHQSLSGYADDLINYLQVNHINNIIYLAHSVNGLLAFIAASRAPHLFDKIILTCAAPSLVYNPQMQYFCGFQPHTLDELFAALTHKPEQNNLKLSYQNTVQLTDILATAFSNMEINEAQSVFNLLCTTDCCAYLTDFSVPAMILQVSGDKISTNEAGYFMYRTIPDSQLVRIRAKGHLPQLEAPEEIIQAINFFINTTVC